MKKQFTFEINAFCIVNEADWGEPVTEQKLQEDISDALNNLCINAEVLVTNLEQNRFN